MFGLRFRETRPFRSVRAFTERYERFLMPTMLIAGTVIDALQFRWLELETTFLISIVYVLICAASMLIMAATINSERRVLRYAQLVAPFFQQFTIGALLSTSLLFYWFSSSFSASWPILGTIALLMVANDLFRQYFIRPRVQVGLFAFILFSLSATFSAYYFNSLSPIVFLFGGAISLAASAIFLTLYTRSSQTKMRLWPPVVMVFLVMNAMYFGHIIPPIPLALKDAGMYFKISGNYLLEGPAERWFERLIPGQDLAITKGQPLYAYTAIYAPTDLSTTIIHDWQYYDRSTNDWITKSRLSFAIHGGRDAGYRGYSLKSNLVEGQWRVSVETENGQVLGRIPFTISLIEP